MSTTPMTRLSELSWVTNTGVGQNRFRSRPAELWYVSQLFMTTLLQCGLHASLSRMND